MAGHDDGLVQRHDARFTEIERRVGGLEIKMATVIAELIPLKEAITNFKNLDKNVSNFMSREAEREKIVKETLSAHNAKMMMVIALFAAFIAALQLGIEWSHHWQHGMFNPPHPITAPKTTGEITNAHNIQPQYAGKEW